jgi:hypothetical protein
MVEIFARRTTHKNACMYSTNSFSFYKYLSPFSFHLEEQEEFKIKAEGRKQQTRKYTERERSVERVKRAQRIDQNNVNKN